MAKTGIEPKQLTNWFVNNRKRYWKQREQQPTTNGASNPAPAQKTNTTQQLVAAVKPSKGPTAPLAKKISVLPAMPVTAVAKSTPTSASASVPSFKPEAPKIQQGATTATTTSGPTAPGAEGRKKKKKKVNLLVSSEEEKKKDDDDDDDNAGERRGGGLLPLLDVAELSGVNGVFGTDAGSSVDGTNESKKRPATITTWGDGNQQQQWQQQEEEEELSSKRRRRGRWDVKGESSNTLPNTRSADATANKTSSAAAPLTTFTTEEEEEEGVNDALDSLTAHEEEWTR
jgi:hypothetical protein